MKGNKYLLYYREGLLDNVITEQDNNYVKSSIVNRCFMF